MDEHLERIDVSLYPRKFDIEYDWWVANAARPFIAYDEENDWFNEQKL